MTFRTCLPSWFVSQMHFTNHEIFKPKLNFSGCCLVLRGFVSYWSIGDMESTLALFGFYFIVRIGRLFYSIPTIFNAYIAYSQLGVF